MKPLQWSIVKWNTFEVHFKKLAITGLKYERENSHIIIHTIIIHANQISDVERKIFPCTLNVLLCVIETFEVPTWTGRTINFEENFRMPWRERHVKETSATVVTVETWKWYYWNSSPLKLRLQVLPLPAGGSSESSDFSRSHPVKCANFPSHKMGNSSISDADIEKGKVFQ